MTANILQQGAEIFPELVIGFIECIGMDAAMKLIEKYGGTVMVIPKGTRECGLRRSLIELLGEKAASAFMFRYGGERIAMPRCVKARRAYRDKRIVDDFEKGTPARKLALLHKMSERNVWGILSKPLPELPVVEVAALEN